MAKEATTPTPEKEVTPKGEKEAITPQKPAGEPTPPEEKVTKLEGEVDTLTKELEQTKTLQSQADKKARTEKIERIKIEKQLKRIQSGEVTIPPEVPEGETADEREIRLTARIGIQNLILENPEYQELLKQDVTLKEVLKNNPFALIGEYLDTEDAVEQIKEKLDDRVKQMSQPKEDKPKEKEEGVEFEPGAIQPPETSETPPPPATPPTPGEEVEESIKKKIKFT